MTGRENPFGSGPFGTGPFGPRPPGGGTEFVQAVTANGTAGLTLGPVVPGKAVSATAHAISALARQTGFSVTPQVSGAVSVGKSIADVAVTAALSAAGVATKIVLKPLDTALTATVAAARRAGKGVAALGAASAGLTNRAVAFAVVCLAPVTAVAVKAMTWALPVMALNGAGIAVRGVAKPLTASASAVSAVVRRTGKAVLGAASAIATAMRDVMFAVTNGSAASAALQKAVNAVRIGALRPSLYLRFGNAVALGLAAAASANIVPEAIRKAVRSAVARVQGAFRGGALLRGAAGLPAVSGARRRGAGLVAGATDARAHTKSSGKTRIE